MKKILIAIATLFILTTGIPSLRPKAEAQISVSLQIFYDNLSPYGDWSYYPRYGYVWHPRAERNFCPYRTRGHWVWSEEYEWVWVSYYNWGWATFHYGRWFYDPYYGWLWVPGYDWAPAWVLWRSSDSYYGWAPLDPGINFSVNFIFTNYSPPANYWSFVPCRYITSSVVYNYVVSPQQNTTIINNTTVVNNYNTRGGPTRNVFVNGPRRNDVQRFASVTPVKVRATSKPGRTQTGKSQVSIYKPQVREQNSAKPKKVVPIEKMKKNNVNANQPQKNQPARTEPQRNQPVKNQPMRNEPQRTQPKKNEPQRNPPQRTEPQKNQPMKKEPPKNQPQKNQPQNNPPPQKEQKKNEPQHQPPQKEQQHQPPQKQQEKKPPPKKKGHG